MAKEKITVDEIRSLYNEDTYAHWVRVINSKLRAGAKRRQTNSVEVVILDEDVIPELKNYYSRAGFSVMQIEDALTISW